MPGCVCLCLPNRGECVFVCVVLAKENLVCAAAMVCAIVTLIVSIFLCECVCGWLSLQKSRPLQSSHETATGWRSWCCHFTHGVRACVFLCVSMFQAKGGPKKKYCVRAYERGSVQKYYCIKFVILHFSCVLLVKWQTCVCAASAQMWQMMCQQHKQCVCGPGFQQLFGRWPENVCVYLHLCRETF